MECQGKLYIHAGCPASGRLATLHAYDLATHTWHKLADAPEQPRGGTAIAAVSLSPGSELVLVRFGGPSLPIPFATITTHEKEQVSQGSNFRKFPRALHHRSTSTRRAQTPGPPSTPTPIQNTVSQGHDPCMGSSPLPPPAPLPLGQPRSRCCTTANGTPHLSATQVQAYFGTTRGFSSRYPPRPPPPNCSGRNCVSMVRERLLRLEYQNIHRQYRDRRRT